MQVVDAIIFACGYTSAAPGKHLSCGTGACAAVVAGIQRGLLESSVKVSFRSGDLVVRWEGENQPGLDDRPCRCGI